MADKLLYMLSKVQHRLSTYIRNELKKEDINLSPGQIGILFVLEKSRSTTMGELSSSLEMDNAAASRLVDRLEKMGAVERLINPDDRRQIILSITEGGERVALILKKIAHSANERIKEGFTDEEIAIFRKVNTAIIEKFS